MEAASQCHVEPSPLPSDGIYLAEVIGLDSRGASEGIISGLRMVMMGGVFIGPINGNRRNIHVMRGRRRHGSSDGRNHRAR